MKYIMLATEIDTHKDVVTRLASEHGIEPSVWIGKENLIRFVEESFPDCAILDKNKLVAGRQDSCENLSVSALKELNSYWDSVDFRDQRVNLLEEFNRYPALGNLRTLDREVLLRKLQTAIFSAIRDKSPDFLFALDTPHNPVNLSAFYLTRWMGIPTLFFAAPGAIVPALIPLSEPGHFSNPAGPVSKVEPGAEQDALDFSVDLVKTTLKKLAKKEKTHWQIFEQERIQESRGRRFEKFKEVKNRVSREILRIRDFEEALFADSLDRNYAEMTKAHGDLPVADNLPSHGLFALHYQPEGSVVPTGFKDTFQGDAVARARELLPPDLELVVKEHPSQLNSSMEGSFGRSPLFYDFVNSLPKTRAISAFSDTDRLLDTTRLVFTLTGSIGIEAAIRGIPVIHFGGAYWSGMPGTFRADEASLADKLNSYVAPTFEEILGHLETLIRESSIPGFADSGTRQAWLAMNRFPEGYEEAFLKRLVRTIAGFAAKVESA